jgi:hypothetical protein
MSKEIAHTQDASTNVAGPQGADRVGSFWTASKTEPPPRKGRFWAWLYQTGVRMMEWDPEFFDDDGAYVLSSDTSEEYEPEFWAPETAIPNPPRAAKATGAA